MDRDELRRWLEAEDDGRDEAADTAFAQLFAMVPKVEPAPAFVDRAVTAAWRWRAKRRRLVALAWAATILVVVSGVVFAYVASPGLASAGIKTLAVLGGHAVPWLVAYTRVAMDWWWTLGRVGSVIVSAVLTPGRAAAIVGVELFGMLALFALLRIAGAGRLGEAKI